MAQKIESWEANDGSLHKSECEAAKRDLELIIAASPCAENTPYAKTMLEWMTGNATVIAGTLTAYAAACPAPDASIRSIRTFDKADPASPSGFVTLSLETPIPYDQPNHEREMAEVANRTIKGLKELARGSASDKAAAKAWLRHYGYDTITEFNAQASFDQLQALGRFIAERQDDGC